MDIGCITIPKSSNEGRIKENLGCLKVKLDTQLDELKTLDEHYVSGWDPTSET